MENFNTLRGTCSRLKAFIGSQFCPYTDFDVFAYTKATKIFVSLFVNKKEDIFDSLANTDFDEHTIEAYLSKNNKIPENTFQFLYQKCFDNNDEANISRLDNTESNMSSLFFSSCNENKVLIIDHLLEKGFDANSVNNEGSTPLHIASIHGYIDIVKTLVQHNATIDVVDANGCTPLMCACQRKQEEVALFLLSSGAKPTVKNADGVYPILEAIRKNLQNVVSAIIDAGYYTEFRDDKRNTPLIQAASAGRAKIVKILLDKGANMNAQDDLGRTALFRAIQKQFGNIAKYLINKGADFLIATKSNELPIDAAKNTGNPEIEKIVSEAPFSCFYHENISLLKRYLDLGGDINIVSSNGDNLLHKCIKFRILDVAKRLIYSGIDVTKANDEMHTPYLMAVAMHDHDLIQDMVNVGHKADGAKSMFFFRYK